MIYRCPLCGDWCEYYIHGNSGYWLQTKNQAEVSDKTIIDEWNTISTPPAPDLQSIAVEPKNSALLVLDMETSICNNYRCIASISKINNLLTKTREMGMLVVYSLTQTGNPSDIAWQLAPSLGDTIVKSNVDKFYKTILEKILQEHCVKTVLITGYAANGAVLHTATSAAFRGYDVIIPVDCMSAGNPYAEQYTAWHMLNSPGTRKRATLTKLNLISFLPFGYSQLNAKHGR
ncbi:cysteine hydrolase [Paenibacillus sp. OV219]|uniref:cysteine hydrolase n=1 Tax=Paenibacillus sp. OV219 TaxID=1884377 RepID=UPI0008D37FC0|nr:cysteine hydrolase [Paenibacillus sp. OV219]SEP16671.1 Nicotinamidase-related amidase [Paenibacillus sp. OV219]